MRKSVIAVFVAVFVVVVTVMIIVLSRTNPGDLSFADSVTVIFRHGENDIITEVTDKKDIERLKLICTGTPGNDGSIPSGGFGAAELVFEGGDKNISVYPALDDSDKIQLRSDRLYFYSIGEDNRKELTQILGKYGVNLPVGGEPATETATQQ